MERGGFDETVLQQLEKAFEDSEFCELARGKRRGG